MTTRFTPPLNSSDLNSQIWRDWFYKLSLAVNKAYEVATSPAVAGMAQGTFPMSGMNGEVQDGDWEAPAQISFTTISGGNGGGGGSGAATTQLIPLFFFQPDDNDDGYVGPPWTM